MKIALIGASGFIGSGVLKEALARGHEVTAIVRNANELQPARGLTVLLGHVEEVDQLASQVAGSQLVISAYNPDKDDTGLATTAMFEGIRRSGVHRVLVVGGAGTLEIAPGKRVVDQSEFPTQWKQGALRTAAVLDLLKREEELDWVFVCPAAEIHPGERTVTYRVGGDQLLIDSRGKSAILIEEYAVAMLDEVEKPTHSRERISIAY